MLASHGTGQAGPTGGASRIPDVFISYNSRDRQDAVRLAAELKSMGLTVWLDQWELQPGKRFQKELVEAISLSRSVAVLLGPSGPGPWQSVEVEEGIKQSVASGKRIVPVILPGVEEPKLPPILDNYTWVDCPTQQTSQAALQRLFRGLTGRTFATSISQVGEHFHLQLDVHPWRQRTLDVWSLPNPESNTQLHLTWQTFGEGIDILARQYRNYGSGIGIDACFGINEAGLIMATLLSSAVFNRDRVKLGFLKCTSGERTTVQPGSIFPDLDPEPTIAVFDSEVKQSDVLRKMVQNLRERYENPVFYFFVLAAMTQRSDLRINSVDDLVSAKFLKDSETVGLQDFFVAFTMAHPGIEPPHGIR